jgi:hypothetical protein
MGVLLGEASTQMDLRISSKLQAGTTKKGTHTVNFNSATSSVESYEANL